MPSMQAQLIAMQASFVAVRQLTQQLDRDLPRLQQLLEHQMQVLAGPTTTRQDICASQQHKAC